MHLRQTAIPNVSTEERKFNPMAIGVTANVRPRRPPLIRYDPINVTI